uniref:Uncharacterized protein n=1 Tax=Scophthalmus maximus TaxID=52904 RepID=A0A8D3AQC7_SCOMX
MGRVSGRGTSCCVALFLALTSVSAVERLNSINDLKKIYLGQSVPKHSLLLLHWFASIIEIDRNNVIQLPFDPNNGDYGSHHYGNFDRLLDPPPHGQRYYTVGNLNTDASEELPDYVVNPRAEYVGGNRDRIIVRIQNGRWQRTDRVFITQHYGISPYATEYDPEHTYEITPNLLRQIREFSVVTSQQELSMLRNRFGSNANESQLWDIRNTWGVLAGLGLLLFIVIKEGYNYNQHYNQQSTTLQGAGNFPEYRQNHGNGDCTDACAIFIAVVIFLALFLFIISSSDRRG